MENKKNNEIKDNQSSLNNLPELNLKLVTITKEQLELREKIIALKEKDILDLKEKALELNSRLRNVIWVAGLLVLILSVFGVKQYLDLDKIVDKTIQERIEDSLGYYEQFTRAGTLRDNGKCSQAISIYQELSQQKKDDELVFLNLIYCLNIIENYEEGFKIILKTKEDKLLPGKFQDILSYNNAGFVLLVKAFQDSKYDGEAFDLLQRAELIGLSTDSPDIDFPLYNLTLYFLATGDISKAQLYADRLKEKGGNIDVEAETKNKWWQWLEKRRPTAKAELQKLFQSAD